MPPDVTGQKAGKDIIMRKTINFNKNWRFILDDKEHFSQPDADESAFRMLNLPHDWSVDYAPEEKEKTGGGGGYGKSGIGWYRKRFTLENIAEGEKFYLYFEGVYMDSTVYVTEKRQAATVTATPPFMWT